MNHKDIVLAQLKHQSITAKDMLKHGIFRLAARINELRDMGYDIETKMEQGINQHGKKFKYGRYFLR